MRILVHLNDKDEEQRAQIFKCLSLFENLLDFQPKMVSNKLMHQDNLIDILLKLLEEGDPKSENFL